MITAKEINNFLNEELNINDIEDTSSNGLQIENNGEIKKIGFAVDACLETFQKAVQLGCQMLIVHHGMIWEGLKYIKGDTYRKIKYLIENNLAVYASHLPLDRHEKYGNNAELARILELKTIKPFGYHNNRTIGFMGETETTLTKIKETLEKNNMKTTTLNFGPEQIKKVALVSGGGSKELYQAIAVGADLYITGESLHFTYHTAKENKINVIFGGHYQTEVWGVQALIPLLKEKFNVETEFIDVPVPI
ncbi:MAG: Nif3-like dinuclear metal center hexameric protein [Nanoarchaeota archaeon]|nr:Nif3-like dinuclear metal center hexameric protein [Nanoarchaeota archaeon]MBU1622303.1 Nif3-like dinuclear metal center hexameric protein [Nanoarchaeota archaeon]MBU1973808.1 Nif3-like dinuclear metal center hexameric protein [Nanoarchaeota archaeon]